MEESNVLGDDLPLPPARLFERLAQISGYTWDPSIEPFHSSYDNWHVFGIRHIPDSEPTLTATTSSIRSGSARSSPKIDPRPSFRHHFSSFSEPESDASSSRGDLDTWIPVVARISNHTLRIEREFHMNKSIIATSDPECKHTIRPVDLVRLTPQPGDKGQILVSIFEAPGRNYLREVLNFGPAFYGGVGRIPSVISPTIIIATDSPGNQVPLQFFLDFAIGASECLELLHHGHRTVHGEIRADAFHYNQESGAVKLVNVGNGPRAFENGLTSEGWTTLSREVGAKNKLQFIAPEQTGRLPTEPDSRTDIYSLGVLFWTMLVGRPGFDGDTPMDVIQNVLARRLPPVSSKRMDVPDAISEIIQRMTQKQIDERYHSASGLKHDLIEIRGLLANGDADALKNFTIAQKDVSSFFVLPSTIIGRKKEQDLVVKIIEKVLKRQQASTNKANAHALYSIDSNSSISEGRVDSFEIGEGSDESSSLGFKESRSNSTVGPLFHSSVKDYQPSNQSNESPILSNKPSFPMSKNSIETRSSWETMEKENFSSNGTGSNHSFNTLGPLARRRGSHKFRRRGRCEVLGIFGGAGMGKSSLIQTVQPAIRKHGYFALSKFDASRKAPFEPLVRGMSSLFRQIFSERDVSTEYHNSIRASVRPVWPMLQKMLHLPESLISQGEGHESKTASKFNTPGLKTWKSETPTDDSKSSQRSIQNFTSHQLSAEFLRGPTSTKSLRFMNTFLEVLRALSHNKLICLCFEDLQNAGEESLELITNIVSARVRVVLIVTCRQEEGLPAALRAVLDTENNYTTKIMLGSLTEEDVLEYVAATLYQPRKSVVPLAAVIQERSNGNPFYMREMLETCYVKHCLWFSWKANAWEYDLDRVFTEFETEHYGQFLNMSFITKKLQEQPPAARAILAWASLLGTTFSFGLIQKLLSGEFLYGSGATEEFDVTCPKRAQLFRQSEEDAVSGLQMLLQSYILVPGESDDEFKFSSDRHLNAAALMRECQNVQKMHFLIAQTLMKYHADDEQIHIRARHICQSVDLIKQRLAYRRQYRNVLFQAAMTAIESGARPTALWYYQNCISLLQEDPWDDFAPDVYYDETLKIYVQAAEIFWYQGQSEEALNLLADTFAHAKTPACKTRSWILQSRLFAQRGDSRAAFDALRTSLIELGLELDETTWEACDVEYRKLASRLREIDHLDLLQEPLQDDPDLVAMGTVLVEAMSAAFWTDALLFFQMAIQMINTHLKRGPFIQIGLGYIHLAMIIVSRFKDVEFALKIAELGRSFLTLYRDDPYTQGRGWTIHSLFINHFQSPIRQSITTLEGALEMTYAAGDRMLSLLNFGSMATSRLCIGMDMAEIESFCAYIGEEFEDWSDDLRGGVQILSTRQVARALQGKTMTHSSYHILSDEQHDTQKYMSFMSSRASNVERPHDIYWSMAMIPLYLYGHYADAVQTGKKLEATMHQLWSLREVPLTLFYLSLSMVALCRENPTKENIDSTVATVKGYKERIDFYGSVNDTNYGMWSLLVGAEIDEISEQYSTAVAGYEAAIDHTQVHGYAIEEALAIELQADFMTRRGARRAARAVLQEAISAWTRINATGKARHLTEKHEYLLKTAITSRTNDVGVQTTESLLPTRAVGTMDEREQNGEHRHGEKIKDERTREWLDPGKASEADKTGDLSGLGLDIIDLSSILEFSQVISSELQIDRSLSKMVEIILESAGGQADFAAIVINNKDGNGWCVVASGGHEKGIYAYPEGIPFGDVEDQVAQQVTLYTLRFKEPIFINNILEDERFSNVTEAYLERNRGGKAIIVLPIMQGEHHMGALYLEGQPHAFTQRNLVVLRLLSQQVGISIANALLFKEVRKVSASNAAMIESQKRALAQARDAEQKAKVAEAEAMRSVKLKEEAAKAKSMFLANVSHELRTPLNGVIGMSELLKGTKLDVEQGGYADSIRVCADTLLTVINDILDFSKLEAGKMKMFSVPLNLRETITEVVRALTYTNMERGLQTIEDLDLQDDLLVLGDPVRLHQIFMNLLSNSYKFTPKGSVTVRAKRDKETKDSIRITCSVIDTGIGISKEQLTKLFQPFSQADSSTARSYGGSGLGLSICKAMIENVLGGKVWLESELNVGTTVSFTLTFPKAPKDATAATTNVSAQDPDPMANWSHDSGSAAGTPPICDLSQIPREDIRVCIAEDNPINQKIAVSFVTKLGLKCEAYNDGQQAYEALKTKSKEGSAFHLVLMDVQMPVLDGYNATRAIRSDEDPNVRGVLVIAMTASAIRGDREKCLEAGMNNYLAKPVRAAVLKTMLDEYLSKTPDGIQEVNQKAKASVLEAPSENGSKNWESSPKETLKSPARTRMGRRKQSKILSDKENTKANLDALIAIPEAQNKMDNVDTKKDLMIRTKSVTPNGTPNGSTDASPKAVGAESQ